MKKISLRAKQIELNDLIERVDASSPNFSRVILEKIALEWKIDEMKVYREVFARLDEVNKILKRHLYLVDNNGT